jgi:hypothetical protein
MLVELISTSRARQGLVREFDAVLTAPKKAGTALMVPPSVDKME